jgi:hypothetical protein
MRGSEAPSICAALMMLSSMPRKPARNKAMANPADCQMPAITTQ